MQSQTLCFHHIRLSATMFFVLSLAGVPAFADDLSSYPLTAKDGRFTPETIEVPAGKKFRLVVNNEGPGPEEFESHALNREKVIPAGQKAEIILGPLKAGTYDFFGEFHPKTAKGQIIAK
jgi:hypothetical protein